jgi:hypothetical protein
MIVPALIAAIPGRVAAIAVPAGVAVITAVIVPTRIAAMPVAAGIAMIPAPVPVVPVAAIIVPAGTPAVAVAVAGLVPTVMIAGTAAIAIMSARLTVPPVFTSSRTWRGVTALAAGIAPVPASPFACIPVATIRPGFAVGTPVFAAVGIAITIVAFLSLGVRRCGHRQRGGQKGKGDKGGAKQVVLAWCHGTRLRVYAGTDPARLTEG